MEQPGGGSRSSGIELPEDGFEWKKYGQKFIKNISKLRAYYKCARAGCSVKKKVEWAESEPNNLRITYEGGQHIHNTTSQEAGPSRSGGSSSDANRYNLIIQAFGDHYPPS
ncbi:hypothetical protein MLD38_040318 [Melastoma candidum]|uniref:Uncharacterized protein n=1 Tax=Melastoma candidum TaxID=119954 RepID=A0ACB9L5C1_9MYRT|nr:hypothetical protein MLD38_040318 [Melastoma candidum]